MKKFILLLLFVLSPLYAQYIKAGYDVSFGVIGKIGKAEITYTQENDNYTILVHAWTTGLSAFLSQNREESYISQGKIVDGALRPDAFVKFRQTDRYSKVHVFLFDHQKKSVFAHKSKEHYQNKTHFDVNTMKNIKVATEEFDFEEGDFRFYTDNDLLSLFFNTKKILPKLKQGDKKELSAIGSKTPNCIIDIEVPQGEKRQKLQTIMSDDEGRLLTIILHQDIFQSKEGELHVIFDEEGLAKDVLLRDVILFGDIRGTRTYLKKEMLVAEVGLQTTK